MPKDYCEQIGEAIRADRHHDTRRHLFLNFLREAFGIDERKTQDNQTTFNMSM